MFLYSVEPCRIVIVVVEGRWVSDPHNPISRARKGGTQHLAYLNLWLKGWQKVAHPSSHEWSPQMEPKDRREPWMAATGPLAKLCGIHGSTIDRLTGLGQPRLDLVLRLEAHSCIEVQQCLVLALVRGNYRVKQCEQGGRQSQSRVRGSGRMGARGWTMYIHSNQRTVQ